ncbi:MAG: amidohydrolase family protein [Fimbriimonadaceae bacterium]|nr:amidohydrolase family protein [Fimbriimonadaceae bacterium]
MNIIDCHTMFGFWPQRRADISPETLVNLVREHQVSTALTMSTTGIFADFNRGNEETVAICRKAGRLLLPIGTIDPRRFVGTIEEIDRLADAGVRIWRLFPEIQGWDLASRPVGPILQRLGERRCTLLISASRSGEPTRIADRTAEFRLPTVLLGVTNLQLGELVAVLPTAPHLLLETRRLADPAVVRALGQRFGFDKLVFGSASPLQYLSSALLPLQKAGLSAADLEQVLGGNMHRRLGGG